MLQVYLTDLAAYNAGSLVGKWIQLPIAGFELSQAISEVLTEGDMEKPKGGLRGVIPEKQSY